MKTFKAMDRYAKNHAITFALWLNDHVTYINIIRIDKTRTIEYEYKGKRYPDLFELYDIFKQTIKHA